MKNQNKFHVKVGDKIKIIAGNEKGLVGVIKALITKNSTAIIDGILPRVKYKKQNSNSQAQKIEIELPVHISNLMLWDEKNNKAGRIGYKLIENIKRRYFKKSGNIL
jgi:large subunit ribosomal protein L24